MDNGLQEILLGDPDLVKPVPEQMPAEPDERSGDVSHPEPTPALGTSAGDPRDLLPGATSLRPPSPNPPVSS